MMKNNMTTVNINGKERHFPTWLVIFNLVTIFMMGMLIGHSINANYVQHHVEFECNEYLLENCDEYQTAFTNPYMNGTVKNYRDLWKSNLTRT